MPPGRSSLCCCVLEASALALVFHTFIALIEQDRYRAAASVAFSNVVLITRW